MNLARMKNRMIAKAVTRFPALSARFVAAYRPREVQGVPWAPVTKALAESTVAIVTTAGLHHLSQAPFDMADPDGDPSLRILDADAIAGDYRITHDYYDHKDADRDINVVFPIDRLREMAAAGIIGAVGPRHPSFMGHIDKHHITTLMEATAPGAAAVLRDDRVDAVVLTPG
jgi:D-proline reductase (dithiol) PrdB